METEVMLHTEKMRQWVYDLWLAAGCAAHEAQLTADHLVGANLAGHDSHGVGMVPRYVNSPAMEEYGLITLLRLFCTRLYSRFF